MRWIGFAMLVACDCEGSATNGGRDGSVASDDADGRDVARPASDASMPMNCGSLVATVRDFQATHPDFETYSGSDAYTGLVQAMLGADRKPVYAHPGATPQTTGPAEFAQWYNDVAGVNMAFTIDLPLTDGGAGRFVFDDSTFFPLDGMGFGDEGNEHNFHFTTELHTAFIYRGGETFTFTGDDDLWLFINDRLALDLGGLHPQVTGTVDLDAMAGALGITPMGTYSMDIFHAERHTNESNFHIETTIDCFLLI
jgi:fibro-slime domain-containing protein